MSLFPARRRLFGPRSTRYAREVPEQRRHEVEQAWRALWRLAAEGCALAKVVHVAAGVTVSVPRVGGVRLDRAGRVCSATVQRHPGQRIADYRDRAGQLADALGCARVLVEDLGADRWMRLRLLEADPLARSWGWSPRLPDGFLARCEDGRLLSQRWAVRPHMAVSGQTGSGKSAFVYAQLAPLAGRRDVRVTGCDPSGLVFRPWEGLPGGSWRASGLGDLTASRRVLAELCEELDRRLDRLPLGVDVLTTDEATPLVVVVLEELPGLYRAAELVDRKVLAEVRGRVARLFSEGRKVGFRCVLLAQRLDAAVLDGAVRAQAAARLTFAADRDGLAMAHPAGTYDADEHVLAAPGVALLTAPGLGTIRVRSPWLSYADYCAAVTSSTRPTA